MDLIQRELTKLATAAVIVDEVVKAAQTQDGMAKEAKMKPGLIALLAALGLAGAGAGAYAGGAFDREKLPRPDDIRKGNRGGTLTPLRHAMARAMRPTPVESAESLRAKAEAEKASNPYNPHNQFSKLVNVLTGVRPMAETSVTLTDNINRLLGR